MISIAVSVKLEPRPLSTLHYQASLRVWLERY